MVPSKSKKDKSRRSSILKSHKPRNPLQNVNTNSSSNENSPTTTTKIKRRVSFAEKKHVKEFCHSTEQGTVWDSTYEEHDSDFKGSFAKDQNIKVDSKEDVSKISSEDDHINIGVETSLNCVNGLNLTDSQSCTSAIEVYEDNDLNFTNPVEMFSQKVPLEQTVSTYPKTYTSKINSELDRTCVQEVSMDVTSLIPVYHDIEDDKQENIQKDVASHQDNFNTNCTMEMTKVVSWRDKAETFVSTSRQQENIHERIDTNSSLIFTEKTKLLLEPMDITEAVSVPWKRIYNSEERMCNIKHATESLISNCNNEAMEITQAVPVFMKPNKSDVEVFKKVPVIVQNYKDTRCNVANNSTVLPTNLQSTQSIVSRRIQNANSSSHLVSDNSMKLTSVLQSSVADTEAFNTNNDRNDVDLNISMEMTTALPSKIYEKSTTYSRDKNTIEEDNLKKKWGNTEHTNKIEFFNDVPMEMTRPVNLYEKNTPHPNSEDTVAGTNLRKNRGTNSDETEVFNNVSMQMTKPINAVLPSIYNKENLRINEPMFRDDRNTMYTTEIQNTSHNTCMEMTEAVLSRNREETSSPIIHEKTEYRKENTNNLMTSSEKTKLLNKSMDITEAVPNLLLREKTYIVEKTAEPMKVISHTAATPSMHRNTMLSHNTSMEMTEAVLSKNIEETSSPIIHEKTEYRKENTNNLMTSSEKTKLLNKSMDITEAVPNLLLHGKTYIVEKTSEPMEVISRIAAMPSTHRNTMLSHNTSMEMTEAVLSRNIEETSSPIIHGRTEYRKENTNNLMTSSEKTKLLNKSMDITEAVPDFLLREKTCIVEKTAKPMKVIFHTTATPNTPRNLPEEDSAESPPQTAPAINNDEAVNISMEITAAIQSTMHQMENITLNVMKHLDVSKSNKSRSPTVNDVPELRNSESRENVTIPREIVETNLHNTSSNTHVLPNDLDHSLDEAMTNANKKRPTHENENTSTKKFRSEFSLVESQVSTCDNVHPSSSRTDNKCVGNERLTEDTTGPIQISALPCESNDTLNKIDECLSKSVGSRFEELESINPPSFAYISSDEDNSFLLWNDKFHISITTDNVPINNNDEISERLEPANTEHDATKDCHENVVTDTIKNNPRADCQVIERTIIDDHRVDESDHRATDIVEHLDGRSALSTSNVNHRKTVTLSNTDHFAEANVTREDQEDEEEHTREEINDEVELRNIEQKEQCSEVGEEVERCIGRLEGTEATIKDHSDHLNNSDDSDDSDSKVNPQSVEQKEDHAEERLDAEQSSNRVEEEESLVEQDPFVLLTQKLEAHAEGKDCIWSVYYKNVDRRMIGFGFMSNSLLIITFLQSDSLNDSEENLIKEVKIISRLADDVDVLIKIVHGLILEKINVETLTHSYRSHEDVLPMLEFVSQDVKLAMDFMFDLKRLDNFNLMEITRDEISFVSRSKRMDIILRITLNVKRFDKLTPSDINICCLLGTIRKTDVKNLIKNVKKDHKFLRRYMSDVRDYLDIMEEVSPSVN